MNDFEKDKVRELAELLGDICDHLRALGNDTDFWQEKQTACYRIARELKSGMAEYRSSYPPGW